MIISKTGPVEKNIDLAFQLLDELLIDPGAADTIPDFATVVVLPSNDQPQALYNLSLGMVALAKGENVYFMHDHVETPTG